MLGLTFEARSPVVGVWGPDGTLLVVVSDPENTEKAIGFRETAGRRRFGFAPADDVRVLSWGAMSRAERREVVARVGGSASRAGRQLGKLEAMGRGGARVRSRDSGETPLTRPLRGDSFPQNERVVDGP